MKVTLTTWRNEENKLKRFLDEKSFNLLGSIAESLGTPLVKVVLAYGEHTTSNGNNEVSIPENIQVQIPESNDHPFGLVLSGSLEIYSENAFSLSGETNTYQYPIDYLNQGDFFGVFGFLDDVVLDEVDDMYQYSVIAGKRCIHLLLPELPLNLTKDNFRSKKPATYFSMMRQLTRKYEIDLGNDPDSLNLSNWLLQYAKQKLKDDKTELLLFPLDWIRSINNNIDLMDYFLKVGWGQSSSIRYEVFKKWANHKLVKNHVSNKHGYYSSYLHYLETAIKGRALLLKLTPQKGSNTVQFINKLEMILQDEFQEYYGSLRRKEQNPFTPKIVYYDYLSNDDFGIAPHYLPPLEIPLPNFGNSSEVQDSVVEILDSLPNNLEIKKWMTDKNIEFYHSPHSNNSGLKYQDFDNKYLPNINLAHPKHILHSIMVIKSK